MNFIPEVHLDWYEVYCWRTNCFHFDSFRLVVIMQWLIATQCLLHKLHRIFLQLCCVFQLFVFFCIVCVCTIASGSRFELSILDCLPLRFSLIFIWTVVMQSFRPFYLVYSACYTWNRNCLSCWSIRVQPLLSISSVLLIVCFLCSFTLLCCCCFVGFFIFIFAPLFFFLCTILFHELFFNHDLVSFVYHTLTVINSCLTPHVSFFQTYNGENKLTFDEKMKIFAFY